jgi:hypothetical protein
MLWVFICQPVSKNCIGIMFEFMVNDIKSGVVNS